MDNFEYLNQISQSNRPTHHSVKPSGANKPLLIKLTVGGVVLFFLLMALGAMLGNLGGKTTELTKQIYVRSTNLNTAIGTYNRSLKTPKLRAIGVSLSSVLTNASNQLSSYLSARDSSSKTALTPSEETAASEAALLAELDFSLTNAKLNGILDRVYDNQIGLQVSLLLSQVSELLARTKDSDLINILTPFQSSLQTIHQDIEAYSSE